MSIFGHVLRANLCPGRPAQFSSRKPRKNLLNTNTSTRAPILFRIYSAYQYRMSLSPQKVDFEAIWKDLAEGVGKIVTLAGVKGMPMYEIIYKLCTAQPHPYSEQLYNRLKKYLEDHVEGVKKFILERQSDLLVEYLKSWTAYSTGSLYCNVIFRYLNQNWIKKRIEDSRNKLAGHLYHSSTASEVYEVNTLALVIWKERLFDAVKDRLTKKLLELIQKERDGDQIDQNQVAGVIQSYVKLGAIKPQKQLEIYKEDFEVHFINGTKDYYARESTAFISLNGVSAYMKIAENRIQEEEKRSKKYLDSSSYDRVRREIDMVLIDKHKDMLQNECEAMFRDDKRDDLSRMYRLLSRIEGLIEPMLLVLQSYVTQQGLEAVKAVQSGIMREGAGPRDIDDEAEQPNKEGATAEKRAENPAAAYVEALLATHRQYSEVVATAFKSDPSFVAALDKACRKVVNDNPINKDSTKSPELLAKYCDLLLKKSTKHLDENALEHKLSQVILIFKYVDDKDVFQKFYSKMLAKRLIHATSVSDDAEKFMIAGLKEACGFEYTSKLQRMFNDIQLSVEINERFKEYTTEHKVALKVDFNIQVLTAGSWPLQTQASSFNVPFELEVCLKEFHKFYDKLHHGRKLHWLHHLSKGDMRMLYLKKKYEVQATNYQMAVLLNYNVREQFSMQELSQATSLSDIELKRTLLSLLDSKVLKKTSSGRALAPTDEFVLNKTFTSKRIRFKITAPLQAETEKQSADTRKVIDDDRKLYLQAAIVRIMKARKMLNHNNLMREVIDQSRTRFIPSVPMIKKCIEQLIEKEYLKREENDKYSYVA